MADSFYVMRQKGYVFLCIVVMFFAILGSLLPQKAAALQLQGRSLRIENPTAGTPTAHTFKFSYATPDVAVGSLKFEYCTNPLIELPCDAPPGVNASGATLTQQTGETGYFVLVAQTNRIVLTRAPALPPTVNHAQYVFTNIVNPTGDPGPFYVRITTYTTTDGSGVYTDFGAVVNATTQGVQLSTEVPPILKFCVGLTIDDDCTTADGNLIDLGDLRETRVSSGTSEMLAATNAEFGLVIAMYGTTMTSGNNTIPALSSPTVSAPGNAQFGLNLRDNANPNVGRNPSGSGNITPASAYNAPNRFAFRNGDAVATSAAATDTRRLTASYIVNVTPSQPPGVYTATLTYICTATF